MLYIYIFYIYENEGGLEIRVDTVVGLERCEQI